jgi:hypothetical protein
MVIAFPRLRTEGLDVSRVYNQEMMSNLIRAFQSGLAKANTRRREDHVVLAARHEGRWLVLDSRGSALVEDKELVHYRALAAFGNDGSDLPAAAPILRLPEVALHPVLLDHATKGFAQP